MVKRIKIIRHWTNACQKISLRLLKKRNVSKIIKYLIKALPACIVGHKVKLVGGSSITASSNLKNLLRKVYITLLDTTIIDNLVIHCFHMSSANSAAEAELCKCNLLQNSFFLEKHF